MKNSTYSIFKEPSFKVVVVIIVLVLWTLLISIYEDKFNPVINYEKVDCYDRYNNVISDLTCVKEIKDDKYIHISGISLFLFVVVYLFGFNNKKKGDYV